MTITGLSGDIGSGKSWKMLQYGLEQAELKKKYLVTNFALNLSGVKRYCAMRKFWWVIWTIDNSKFSIVSFVPQDSRKENMSLVPFFKDRQNSICLLDEAGIFLNSRNFANTPAQLLMDLAQSRKSGNDLIWAAQFDTQVDVQFRNLTQFWIQCDGWTAYDKQMRRPKLVWRTYFYFKGAEYQRWLISAKARTSFLRTYFAFAFKTDFGPMSKTDIALFGGFDSFTRLEKQASAAIEIKDLTYRTDEELIENGYYKRNHHNTIATTYHPKQLAPRWSSELDRKVSLTKIRVVANLAAFRKYPFWLFYDLLEWSIRRRHPRLFPSGQPSMCYIAPPEPKRSLKEFLPPVKAKFVAIAAVVLLVGVTGLFYNPAPPAIQSSQSKAGELVE